MDEENGRGGRAREQRLKVGVIGVRSLYGRTAMDELMRTIY